MPEIKVQQSIGNMPEVASGEIHMQDDSDWGTGTFKTTFKPNALPPTKVISSMMINAPRFQITVTLNQDGVINVALGTVDGTPPRHITSFVLPDSITAASHVLIISFARWFVLSATFDGIPLRDTNKQSH